MQTDLILKGVVLLISIPIIFHFIPLFLAHFDTVSFRAGKRTEEEKQELIKRSYRQKQVMAILAAIVVLAKVTI